MRKAVLLFWFLASVLAASHVAYAREAVTVEEFDWTAVIPVGGPLVVVPVPWEVRGSFTCDLEFPPYADLVDVSVRGNAELAGELPHRTARLEGTARGAFSLLVQLDPDMEPEKKYGFLVADFCFAGGQTVLERASPPRGKKPPSGGPVPGAVLADVVREEMASMIHLKLRVGPGGCASLPLPLGAWGVFTSGSDFSRCWIARGDTVVSGPGEETGWVGRAASNEGWRVVVQAGSSGEVWVFVQLDTVGLPLVWLEAGAGARPSPLDEDVLLVGDADPLVVRGFSPLGMAALSFAFQSDSPEWITPLGSEVRWDEPRVEVGRAIESRKGLKAWKMLYPICEAETAIYRESSYSPVPVVAGGKAYWYVRFVDNAEEEAAAQMRFVRLTERSQLALWIASFLPAVLGIILTARPLRAGR